MVDVFLSRPGDITHKPRPPCTLGKKKKKKDYSNPTLKINVSIDGNVSFHACARNTRLNILKIAGKMSFLPPMLLGEKPTRFQSESVRPKCFVFYHLAGFLGSFGRGLAIFRDPETAKKVTNSDGPRQEERSCRTVSDVISRC